MLLYTCWTAPSLTFDLLCRLRMMLNEAKLSPTSASICTTNQMLGKDLSNKCFIMPKSLNNNIEKSVCFGQIFSCSDDKHFQVNYIPNTHTWWISNLLLCADWLLDSPENNKFFWFESCRQHDKHRQVPKRSSFLEFALYKIICNGHETIAKAYWILMEKYLHATSTRGE